MSAKHSGTERDLVGEFGKGLVPLYSGRPYEYGDIPLYSRGGYRVCDVNAEHPNGATDTAAYIVRCVNSHEALVSALSTIDAWLIAPSTSKEDLAYIRSVASRALSLARGGGE